MQVRYRITLEDYRDAQRLKVRRATVVSLLVLAFPLLLLFSSALTYRDDVARIHTLLLNFRPYLTVLLIVVLYWLVLRPLSIRRTYAKNPVLHREITADFDATGMDAGDDSGGRSKVPWSHFNRFSEGKRVFILGTPGNIFNIISKSGMSTEEQEAFRSLLEQYVVGK